MGATDKAKWIKAAEEWGSVCLMELVLSASARGIVKVQHEREAARSGRLAARYAIRFFES